MPNKRNLLIIAYDFPPSTGGVARLCSEITKGMHLFYNSVTVMTIDYGNESFYDSNGIAANFIKLPPKRLNCELRAIKELRKIKNKKNYDVLCGVWHPEALLAVLGGMRHIYVLGHGTEFLSGTSKFRGKFWLPIYSKWILKKVSKVICNSNYTKSLVSKISPKIKTEALPLAVDHKFFSPKKEVKKESKKIKIATVSRILKFKGHHTILQAIENLKVEFRDRVEWNIAGSGPYLKELKELVENSAIKNQVNFQDFVPDKDLPDFYRSNDVFMLLTEESDTATYVEGFGLVFLEAQACGLAVLGSKTGGISDAISEGDGGWLIEQKTPFLVTQKIEFLLKNPHVILLEGAKARKRIEQNYTWEVYCEKLFKLMK